MRVRLELTQSGRFLVMLASLTLGAAWTTGHPAARLAACLLLAPLLVDWAAKTRDWSGLSFRVGRRRTRAGAPFVDRLVLRNGTRHALWHAHLAESGLVMSGRGQAIYLERLAAGGELEIEAPLRARGRGRAAARTLGLTTQHPLGLIRARLDVATEAVVVAEPARIPLDITIDDDRSAGGVPDDAPTATAGETFWSLRELEPGEDIGRVHALRSAALRTPVCTIERGAERIAAVLVLDLRSQPARAKQRAGGRAFEWAMSATASLVEALGDRRREVDVVVLEPRPRWFRTGAGEADALLEFLAGAAPVPFAPLPPGCLDEIAARAHERYAIAAQGQLATDLRVALGDDVQVLEWS